MPVVESGGLRGRRQRKRDEELLRYRLDPERISPDVVSGTLADEKLPGSGHNTEQWPDEMSVWEMTVADGASTMQIHLRVQLPLIRSIMGTAVILAATGAGIEPLDVDVLKLLYLIRYVQEDIPANIDNIVILMADNINIDPIAMRKRVAESLNRLFSQNYIGRSGDTWNFLTDAEQDKVIKAIEKVIAYYRR